MKARYAISLGLDCAMAGMLDECKVRTVSLPFDWLDGADVETRLNLIQNDFADFFNKEDLEQIVFQDDPQRDKDRYKNKRTGLNFHHDFVKGKNFNDDFIEVDKKYKRRIKNFNTIIKRGGVIYFVLDRKGNIIINNIKSFADVMKQYIVIISNDDSVPDGDILRINYGKYILQYKIKNTPTDLRDEWEKFKGNKPIISKIIFENVKVDNKLKKILQKTKYKLWKHLDKRIEKTKIFRPLYIFLWKKLSNNLMFTSYIRNREELQERLEKINE